MIHILLLQLGTPDEPSVPAVRRYLRQFLGDPRVIESPRLLWWFILNFSVLRTRPAESAAKYRRIWDKKTGSPLLFHTKNQTSALGRLLQDSFTVNFAMRYGNPSIPAVLDQMIQSGAERIIVFPMYPQYSATSTASALDALFDALKQQRNMPAIRIVPPYYGHPAYIDAVATIIEETAAPLDGPPDHSILTFHGIPISYTKRGDPYAKQVEETTRLLVQRLGWAAGTWQQTYQSQFGREEWLQPYTEPTLHELAREGKKKILIASPGFTADCLETIDEIGFEYLESFLQAGGKELIRCPCLNDHPKWIEAMATIVREEAGGWI